MTRPRRPATPPCGPVATAPAPTPDPAVDPALLPFVRHLAAMLVRAARTG